MTENQSNINLFARNIYISSMIKKKKKKEIKGTQS